MPRELGAPSRFHNPVTPGTMGQSQIAARRDSFELADAFLSIRDLAARARIGLGPVTLRTEEHTSELQSLMRISPPLLTLSLICASQISIVDLQAITSVAVQELIFV